MATNYKILGQAVNTLSVNAPSGGSLVLSKLKIKNTSSPTAVDVFLADDSSGVVFKNKVDSTYNPLSLFTGSSYASAIAEDSEGNILVGVAEPTDSAGVFYIKRIKFNGIFDINFYSLSITGSIVTIYSIVVQPDGKILIAGLFTAVGGTTRNRIARLNADGTLDSSFNPNANGSVNAMALQSDGKIIIGGSFTTVGGTARNRIARLNADGSLDSSFNPNADNPITDIALQSDGKILVAGNFSTIGGSSRNSIARLNSNGSADSFAPTVPYVYTVVVQPNGKILAGGSFNNANGAPRHAIARFNSDGSLDSSFNPALSMYGGIYNIALQSDGSLIIVGTIKIPNETDRYIAKLNSDGSVNTYFNPVHDGSASFAYTKSDGNLLISGGFTQIDGVTVRQLALLNEYAATPFNKNYLVKGKELSFDDEIEIKGGIAVNSLQTLVVESSNYESDTVIIQAYGIEETA